MPTLYHCRYVYISDPLHYYIRTSDVKVMCLIVGLWATSGSVTLTPYLVELIFFDQVKVKSMRVSEKSECV